MSETLETVLQLVQQDQVLVSEHGYDELTEDNIYIQDILDGVVEGFVVEDYPDFTKGPCVLVLQKDPEGCNRYSL